MLCKALHSRGLKDSAADSCVFLHHDLIVLVYIDDCILISKNKSAIEEFINSLKQDPENFIFTDKGDLNKYLGIQIKKLGWSGSFKLKQPFLIESILQAANIDTCMTNSCPMPVVSPFLNQDTAGPIQKHNWKYRTLTGMLGYLQQTSQPEISIATHQCACFNNDPKPCHKQSVK